MIEDNEVIKEILERLEAIKGYACNRENCERCPYDGECIEGEQSEKVAIDKAIAIVQEVAKDGGWIPCSERLPEEHESIFAKFKGTDNWDEGMYEKLSDDVSATIEFSNGARKTKVLYTVDGKWTDGVNVNYKVIAWQPLPAPYQKGEQYAESKVKIRT